MKYLLDTNVLLEPTFEKPSTIVIANLRKHWHDCVIASMVWHELHFGAEQLPSESKRRQKYDAVLAEILAAGVEMLPYDREAAEWHAAIRLRSEPKAAKRQRGARRAKDPHVEDAIIASIAVTRGRTLVTANTADFMRFMPELSIVDWSRP